MNLEKEVMIHRYCYYVLAEPLLPDAEYDKIEQTARATLPETSPVHAVGSSLPSSYSDEVRREAERRQHGNKI